MKKNKVLSLLSLLLAIALLTACGGAAETAEPAPAAQEAAPETNAPAEEAPAEEAASEAEEPAPLTADQITYEDVLDDTDLLDGETVALHATSDLVVMPSLVCYDMFGIPEAVQQKAAITEDVHMLGMTIDNKTDKLLYPVACPGSLRLNGQSIADERFALATINTIFAGMNVYAEESVNPGDSSQMVFFLLAGEELLPELTGLDHIETVEFSFDLLDEAGSVVDTVDVNFAASRPLTEEELAAKNAEYAPIASTAANVEGILEIEISPMEIGVLSENDIFSEIAWLTIRNVCDRDCDITLTTFAVNGVKSKEETGVGYEVKAGETTESTLIVPRDVIEELGITTADEIESITADLVVCYVEGGEVLWDTPAAKIEGYSLW